MIVSTRSLRFKLPFFLTALLLLAAFKVTDSNSETRSAITIAEYQDQEEDFEWAQCESYCSPTKPGTSVAEFRWRVSPQPLSARDLARRKASERIQVTVYKDGFERGYYAEVMPVGTARKFAMRTPRRRPGLSALVLADVATTQEKNKPGFRLLQMPDQSGEWAVARVEGLEAGLLYFWRLQGNTAGATPDKIVRCLAATCPVDSGPRRRTR